MLLLPSKLTALAKDVFGTLVVNPGSLTRGVGGGTYAQLNIHAIKEADLRASIVEQSQAQLLHQQQGAGAGTVPSADAFPHNICSRTSVTISKI